MLLSYKPYWFPSTPTPPVTNDSYVQLFEDESGKKIQMYENTIGTNLVEAMAITLTDPTGWTDSYVQVAPDSTGKKIQYFENTIGGQTVLAQALVLVDTSGAPV